jgi:hypothetical protein
MTAVLHHENLLLYDAEVVPGLQLDHLDGGILPTGQPLGLNSLIDCYHTTDGFWTAAISRTAENFSVID